MNNSKLDSSKKDTGEKIEKRQPNIREIYLQAVHHNKGFKKYKKGGFTNLAADERHSANSSTYLEKELNLVQRIISDTKELKNIKNRQQHSNEPKQHDNVAHTLRQTATKYKTQEEYYQEVLALKKAMKQLENNELITRAKLEYYDNEMSKKEQEIIDILDVKKCEELRLTADSKVDLGTLVYGLKQKAYKLEFALKRKENELSKLKAELKTTDMKELKVQNERLRVELAKALMNDKKIIEVFQKNGVPNDSDGRSYYDSDKFKSLSEISLQKNEIMKRNIAKQLQGEASRADSILSVTTPKDMKSKLVLKGSVREKLEQLDERETELLKHIAKLDVEVEQLQNALARKSPGSAKVRLSSSGDEDESDAASDLDGDSDGSGSLRHSGRSSRESVTEKSKLTAIRSLQSVMRGHLERIQSLGGVDDNSSRRFEATRDERERDQERPLNHRRDDRKRSESREREQRRMMRDSSSSPFGKAHRQRYAEEERGPSPRHREQHRRFSEDDEEEHDRERSQLNGQRNHRRHPDDAKRQLIEPKEVKKVDGTDNGCCSSFRLGKPKNKQGKDKIEKSKAQ